MVAAAKPKVGIISCSGEELPEGTVSRVATRLVLEALRSDRTVTLCLPLFLAGGEEERDFARRHPTIAVDGCAKRCAAKATAAYSAEPAAVVVVNDVARRFPQLKAESRRRLGAEGMALARLVAEEVAAKVDEILARPATVAQIGGRAKQGSAGSCACMGGALPAKIISVAGEPVGIAGLDRILAQLCAVTGRSDDQLREDLLATVKIYNYVPPAQEAAYAGALWAELVAYRARQGAGA